MLRCHKGEFDLALLFSVAFSANLSQIPCSIIWRHPLPYTINTSISQHLLIFCMSLCVALSIIFVMRGWTNKASGMGGKEPSTRLNRISNDRSRLRGTCSLSALRCRCDVEDHAWRSVDSPLTRLITLKCGLSDACILQDYGEVDVDDLDTGSQLPMPPPKNDGNCGSLS